jgi:excisionase family DNA binding protein
MTEVRTTPKIMTSQEVAEYLNVHLSTIYKMVRRGEIPAFKVGGDIRFHRDAIEKWCAAKTIR